VSAEQDRLAQADAGAVPWRAWGPYLAERAWGTVREDYSESGEAWSFFPFDHAHLRAYRWNEDGLGGVCDDQQLFCFAFAFYNGVDPVLKERVFGLTGPEGNHGEDAKEYWWYLDSTPTHSHMAWRYHYPQTEFPYHRLRTDNHSASRDEPEVELLDTGAFDGDRYWSITARYAKAGPHDMAIELSVTNRGPDEATLEVLPTLWFRNTWAWGDPAPDPMPAIRVDGARLRAHHPDLGHLQLVGDGEPTGLACDNETNAQYLWRLGGRSRYPKDGINNHVIDGARTVNPDGVGTKAALRYQLTVPSGDTAYIRLRLALTPDEAATAPDLGADFARVLDQRAAEADEFYAARTPIHATADEALVLRQAAAGLLWSKQFYHYDVGRWLTGDPDATPPPAAREYGRNARWSHLRCHDVILMPDKWEYPWFAAWDLAFHAVAMANIDPEFAKQQVELLLTDRYMHADGQLPAYEWAFDDVNPPVHAWAALQVFRRDGHRDRAFLARVLPALERNFDWWMRSKTVGDRAAFGGGFLGLDNVGPFDRTWPPGGAELAQSDGTAWMAMFALQLAEITTIVAEPVRPRRRWATRRHRAWWRPQDPLTAAARKHRDQAAAIIADAYAQGLWNEPDRFFYDVLCQPDGSVTPVPLRTIVGLLPLAAVSNSSGTAMVDAARLRQILQRMLDSEEFLSSYGIRSQSAAHRDAPVTVTIGGHDFTAGYEPAESRTSTFGGNSNWRGPIWLPVNLLLIDALRAHHRRLGGSYTVSFPTRDGRPHNLDEVAEALSRRVIHLFLADQAGNRPVQGPATQRGCRWPSDPAWREGVPFYEYFHADTGAGLGASHQSGWTALVIDLIRGPAPSRG
jgi:hypothetical protein